MEKIIQFETTQFDLDLIEHIKTLRKLNNITKEKLSLLMGVSKTFVGNVESYTQRHKYSTRHITLLAKAFGFDNVSQLLNFPTPKYDKIKVTIKQTLNENGTKVIHNEVVKIEAL
ncbi:helix-turn-helix domain-containing protein [Chryseobacterium flavum]|uniref:helix-turn-helix domain-containing protein n=1 Tax=Chryseobacterium flavum TaxID=415851 RepID=UPI0028A654C3|nr:helix-turn-helix transcriptional regulator [Chryseobacterium flavum]